MSGRTGTLPVLTSTASSTSTPRWHADRAPEDCRAVDTLLEQFPGDTDLEPRSTRTVWAAVPDGHQDRP